MSPKYTQKQKHVQAIYGATANFFFSSEEETYNINKDSIQTLMRFAQKGYVFTNPEKIFGLSADSLQSFEDELCDLIKSTTKSAFYLRKTFATGEKLTDYTRDDWNTIYSQYRLTYGYATAEDEETLSNYIGNVHKSVKFPAKEKEITIMFDEDHIKYIVSIMESKIPLRKHQEAILMSVDWASFPDIQ